MKEKRYHIVLTSIVFAVLMWIGITMGYDYTIVKHVPVVLDNMKPGATLKYSIPRTVAIRFKGQGWELVTMGLMGDVKYHIDVSSLTAEYYLITGQHLSEHIKTPLTIQPLDIKPETLMLALAEMKEKRVPVLPNLNLRLRDGYGQVGLVRVTPDSVLISASKTLLEPIRFWQTEHIRHDDLRAPLDILVRLVEPASVSMEVYPPTVRIQVDVQQFAEKTFPGIYVTAGTTPANREVIFIPQKIDVMVRGGIEQLAKLSPDAIQAVVDYQTLLEDSSGIVIPTVTAPSGIKIIQRTPERFQYFIRKKI